jgi:hypothetical protein
MSHESQKSEMSALQIIRHIGSSVGPLLFIGTGCWIAYEAFSKDSFATYIFSAVFFLIFSGWGCFCLYIIWRNPKWLDHYFEKPRKKSN